MELPEIKKIAISDADVSIKTTRSGGNGGQAVNKIESCVVLAHKATGITVRCEFGPSQYQNKIMAFEILQAKLESQSNRQIQSQYNSDRRNQMGSGQRAGERARHRH